MRTKHPCCVEFTMCAVKRKAGVIFVLFLSVIYLGAVSGFNLDVEFPDVRPGPPGSMFGYSVAQHVDQKEGWLYIGAPKAQTIQPGIVKGGAVYRCRVSETNSPCEIVPFDVTGNADQFNGTYYLSVEDKSHQWFGATVKSSGKDGYILACAPRFVYKSTSFDKRAPVGTCYLARSLSTAFQEFSPCRTSSLGQDKQGFCMAGFSSTFSKNGERLLIGAPGAYYWQGQVFNIWLDDGNTRYYTREGPLSSDDSYQGYSSAVGNFDADEEEDYVIGVPRGDNLRGKVILYTQNLTNLREITGEQIGAYFGYAVAVQDLDDNKLDDIIVGAPLYSDYSSTDSYDTGRVYIYYQTNKRKFRPNKRYDILEGFEPRSRFGTAIIGLGDINVDGYNDLAVGAPYGGENKKGVVYIYMGSEKGIITKASQVIEGMNLGNRISTFGFSLSGGFDLDNNKYPDLLVGAFNSDKAVYLRARPIVQVAANIKIEPGKVSLEETKCKLPWNNEDVTCTTVFTCVRYAGIGVPPRLNFDFNWRFDTLKNNSKRVYHLNTNLPEEEDKNIQLTKTKFWCKNSYVYIQCTADSTSCDKLTPIKVEFEFKLRENTNSRSRRSLKPILDQFIQTVVDDTAHIEKECGDDEICIPDVYGSAYTFTNDVPLGSKTEIQIVVQVENRGEGAYESSLYIELPEGVQFTKIDHKKFKKFFYCDVVKSFDTENVTNQLIVCHLGNPFPTTIGKKEPETTSFTLVVSPFKLQSDSNQLLFNFVANSSNPENNTMEDNYFSVSVPVVQKADLTITGQLGDEHPEQIKYNNTGVELYKNTGNGPAVVHEYEVRNLGPSDIYESLVNIYWPSYDDRGNNLLYITKPIEVIGDPTARCEVLPITPLNQTIWYSEKNKEGKNVDIVLQDQEDKAGGMSRARRSTGERVERDTEDGVTKDSIREIVCFKEWCTLIRCYLGYMKPQASVIIRITSRLWTDTLVKSGLTSEPYYLVSQALAKVTKMPYDDLRVIDSTWAIESRKVRTYLNAERLAPRPQGVEPWVIAVAISAGLLLLLLLIVLLWWCGFFRRKRPEEEQPFSKPLITNGANAKMIAARPYE